MSRILVRHPPGRPIRLWKNKPTGFTFQTSFKYPAVSRTMSQQSKNTTGEWDARQANPNKSVTVKTFTLRKKVLIPSGTPCTQCSALLAICSAAVLLLAA